MVTIKLTNFFQEEQLRKEFKIRALEHHPDKHEDDEKETCNEQFQRLKRAKEVLLDKETRCLYDKWLLGGIMMSFEQFQNYTKNNCQSFHWASKKPDPMLTCNSTSQPTNQANQKASDNKLERKNSKLNLKDTPVFKSNDFHNDIIWSRNDTSNELLQKFRNYEI